MVPGSTFRYGSNFWFCTRRPRCFKSLPRDAAQMPLPRPDTTPPVIKIYFILYASNSQFPQKQNTVGIVPPRAQNVKNETFTKIKREKTRLLVEPAEISASLYFFLAPRIRLCYTGSVPTAGGVCLRRAVFYACPHIADSAKPRLSYDRRGAFAGFQCVSLYLRMPRARRSMARSRSSCLRT